MGSLIKQVFSKKLGVSPDQIVTVGIMPCVAKKDEIERPQLKDSNGKKETEYVLTTRELGRLLREFHVPFGSLPVGKKILAVFASLFFCCRIPILTRLWGCQLVLLRCLRRLEE